MTNYNNFEPNSLRIKGLLRARVINLAKIVVLIMSMTMAAQAQTWQIGGYPNATNVTATLTGDGTLTISGTGAMLDYSWEWMSGIGSVTTAPWRDYYNTIRTVIILDGVTTIGVHAFSGCSSLTDIAIPKSVTSIGENAFARCSLTTLVIPASVSSIGDFAFWNNSGLNELIIEDGSTSLSLRGLSLSASQSIGYGSFGLCPIEMLYLGRNLNVSYSSHYGNRATFGAEVKEVTFGSNVTSIGNYTFYYCRNLTEVTIPNSVVSIGDYAFYHCNDYGNYGLRNIYIGNSVKYIGNYAFYYCHNLTEVNIPNLVESIGDYAFYHCISLKEVTIPDLVKSIGDYTFSRCSGLEEVTIGNSVITIGDYAFSNCSNLVEVTIPNSVESIGNSAFRSCGNLTNVYFGNSVTSIGDFAFYSCCNLNEVIVPSTVTTIGIDAFGGCINSCERTIASGNITETVVWSICENGILIIGGSGRMLDYPSIASVTPAPWGGYHLSSIRTLIIDDGVTHIGTSAFRGLNNLTEATIPNSVTTIGEGAFRNCSSLIEITIPNAMTAYGSSIFRDCSSLKNVTILSNWVRIPAFTFQNCISLTEFTIPSSVGSLESSAFQGCSNLKVLTVLRATPPARSSDNVFHLVDISQCTLRVPAGAVENYRNATLWKDFGQIRCEGCHYEGCRECNPDGVCKICDEYGCEKSHPIPGSITVTGTHIYGETITANTSGTETLTLFYKWKRNGEAITGATNDTYTLVAADVGNTVTVEVSAAYYTGVLDSAPTEVAQRAIVFTGSVTAQKQYDGNVYFNDTHINIINEDNFSNLVNDDNVSLDKTDVTGNMNEANVGIGVLELTANFKLSGADMAYYTLTAQPSVEAKITKAIGVFPVPKIINVIYVIGMTLADVELPEGYVWVNIATDLNIGNDQQYPANYTDISGNFETALGDITVNVLSPTYSIALNPATDKNFGTATAGYDAQPAHSVTVNNEGNQPTGALTIALNGANAESFALSKISITNITADGSDIFNVVPKTGLSVGTYNATVTVSGNTNITSRSFNVSFEVTPEPTYNISLNPSSNKDFVTATVGYGVQPAHNVTVSNSGNQPTGELTIALTGANATSFTLSKTSITNIAADGNDFFTIVPISGLGEGTYSATVTVSGENITTQSFDLTFAVTAVPTYGIALNPAMDKDFGTATAGYGAQLVHSVTVDNTGNQPTGTLSIAMSGANAGSFTLSKTSITDITAGGSDIFTVVPQTGLSVGTYNATVTVSGNTNITSRSFNVTFAVTAVSTYGIALNPATDKDFGTSTVGYGAQQVHNVTVSNTGNYPTGELTISLSGANAGSFIRSKTSIPSIAVGGSDNFTVVPQTGLGIGTYSATVTISGENITAWSFNVTFAVIAAPNITSAPELTPANPLRAWMRGGLLHVTGLSVGELWSVYSANGALIYSSVADGEEADIPLHVMGVYIIRSGNNTVRVAFD